MKFLVAAPETLGEIVCSTAVVRCLKQQYPDAELHYWVNPQWAPSVQFHPHVDVLLPFDDDPTLLPEVKYEVLIDLEPSRHLRQWAKSRGVRYLSCAASFLVSFLAGRFSFYQEGGLHLTNRFFEAVKPLGVFNDGLGPTYHLGVDDLIGDGDIPAAQSAGFIALVAGEQDYDKPIPLGLLEAFCSRIQHPLILVSSRGNNAVARRLAAIDPIKLYNACGKFSLNETADLIRRAKMVLTAETGLMQVAAAFGKSMLVWRSSDGGGSFFPPVYTTRHHSLQPPQCNGWAWPSGKFSQRIANGQLKNHAAAERWINTGLETVAATLASQRNR